MPGFGIVSREVKFTRASVTFDGVNYGVAGTPVTVFNLTGRCWLFALGGYCMTTLVGTSATLALGTANSTGSLIAATTATNIQANKWWVSTSPSTDYGVEIEGFIANGPIALTIATANITAGQMDFYALWYPCSAGANIG
jgi:hypothetical protein